MNGIIQWVLCKLGYHDGVTITYSDGWRVIKRMCSFCGKQLKASTFTERLNGDDIEWRDCGYPTTSSVPSEHGLLLPYDSVVSIEPFNKGGLITERLVDE